MHRYTIKLVNSKSLDFCKAILNITETLLLLCYIYMICKILQMNYLITEIFFTVLSSAIHWHIVGQPEWVPL